MPGVKRRIRDSMRPGLGLLSGTLVRADDKTEELDSCAR